MKTKIKKKKGGYPDDKEPLAATELFIQMNNNTTKISDLIDDVITSVLDNKVNKESNVSNIPNFNFEIINKNNDNLINDQQNKRSPTFSYNTYVPNSPFRYKHKANFSLKIPQYTILIEKNIAKQCAELTHNSMMIKIKNLIQHHFVSKIKSKILSQINDNRSKFIFLYRTHMIYIQLDLYTYRNIYRDISMDIYYVNKNTQTEFFNAHIKNLYSRDDKWNIVYDYEHEKLRFEALHRLEKNSKKTSRSSNNVTKLNTPTHRYTLQSMPVELIDMQFDFLYNDHISEAAIFNIIQT
jgi:hypothetical protein